MVEQISAAVSGATVEMQRNLADQIAKSMEIASQELEERVARAKDCQDALLNIMKADQERFQTELRSSLSSLKVGERVNGEAEIGSIGHRNGKGIMGQVGDGGAELGRPGGSGIGSGRTGQLRSGRIGEFGSGPAFSEIGGNVYNGGSNWRFKKLDLSVFEGANPDGWILRAE